MARKTFISYKYSEARGARDAIIDALGEDATYYQGETSDSPDLTDTSTENIKRNLRDMVYGTSVTIVVVSPQMKNSKWIDWEIEYSLKEITREDRTSRTNGVVGVIMKCDGGYDWIVSHTTYADGCTSRILDSSKLYPIITANRFNSKEPVYTCQQCKTIDMLTGSYISLIEQDEFLKDPSKYIENAYEKSTRIDDYNIRKTR